MALAKAKLHTANVIKMLFNLNSTNSNLSLSVLFNTAMQLRIKPVVGHQEA